MLELESVCRAGPWPCHQSWRVSPRVPPPRSPPPTPAQAHPQLPKTKFSCFVGPSVPEPGRVKRSEASWGAKGSGVNKVHRPQPSPFSISPAPRHPSHPTASFRSYLNPYLLLPHSLGAYTCPIQDRGPRDTLPVWLRSLEAGSKVWEDSSHGNR